MFVLVLIDDDIPVRPADFKHDCRTQLKRQIQCKYVDRVIPNVGLCVEFYEFVRIRDALIYPGDGMDGVCCGEAYFKVEFNLIVFRPSVGEWLVGSIRETTHEGIKVSLKFFEDVFIPSSNLRTPFLFDEVKKCFAWQYKIEETNEVINYFYEKDALIRFRVVSVQFPEVRGPQEKAKGPCDPPMKLIGAVDMDFLGCTAWWPEFCEPRTPPGPATEVAVPIEDDSWADNCSSAAVTGPIQDDPMLAAGPGV